jgi:uncharacterized protein (DUF58 family)
MAKYLTINNKDLVDWEKDTVETVGQRYSIPILLTIVLFLTALITTRPNILVIIGFFCLFLILISYYNKQIGRNLYLRNTKRSLRVFEGNKIEVDFRISNASHLPYLNPLFSFHTSKKGENDAKSIDYANHKNHFQVPLPISGHSETEIKVPIKAINRGVIRIQDIQISFPHFINFENVLLKFKGNYQTEIVVYPKYIPVAGLEQLTNNNYGNQVTQYSPFEDQLSPLGIRDYVQSDPFYRVHWKASAKSQTLKTKIFERNRKISWTIIVNLTETSPLGNRYYSDKFERYLSQAAYLCQVITKESNPLQIYLNTSKFGRVPYHVKEGVGTNHLKRILELMARLEDDFNMVRMIEVLHNVDHSIQDSNMIIFIGALDGSEYYMEKWAKQGKNIFHVTDNENGAALQQVSLERSVGYGAK